MIAILATTKHYARCTQKVKPYFAILGNYKHIILCTNHPGAEGRCFTFLLFFKDFGEASRRVHEMLFNMKQSDLLKFAMLTEYERIKSREAALFTELKPYKPEEEE